MSKKKPRVVPGNGSPDKPRLNEKGQEVLDITPVTLPVRYQRGENITERVQRMVEETLSRRAEMQGLESLDDANDFYVEGDDYFPSSEHEVDDDAERAYFEQRERRRFGSFLKGKKAAPVEGDGGHPPEARPPAKPNEGADKGTGGT